MYWFKARRGGWGWYPATWQGWLVAVGYIVLVIGLTAYVSVRATSFGELLFKLFAPLLLITAALTWICFKKGELPHQQL